MENGRCPQCRREGLAGEPCVSEGCRLRRYHCVPQAYAGGELLVSPDLDDPMLGRVVADFLVVGVLGSGGFGNVHHVLQLPLRARPVQGALKRLRPASVAGRAADDSRQWQNRATMLGRFESEADALASLSHPNIVKLLKAGVDGDVPYLVLELVTDAETLEKELDDHAREGAVMSEPEAVAIVEQALSALEAAHAQNIVHRDVKPGNIMIQRVAGYNVFVRVLDFGLAKFMGESTGSHRVMGTLGYMAPEQLRGTDIGPWTDLYALGLVLLAMLTGRYGFSTEHAVLVNEKLDPGYDPVRRALGERDLPADKAAFLRRAVAHRRQDRYTSVAGFRRALREAFGARGPRKPGRTRELGQPLLSVVSPEQPTEILDELPRAVRSLRALTPEPASPPARDRAPGSPATPPPRSPSESAERWPLLAAIDRARALRPPPEPEPKTRPAPTRASGGPTTERHGDAHSNPRGYFETIDEPRYEPREGPRDGPRDGPGEEV